MARGRKSKKNRSRQGDARLRNPGRVRPAPNNEVPIEEAVPVIGEIRSMLRSREPLGVLFYASSIVAACEQHPTGRGEREIEVDGVMVPVPQLGEFVDALIGTDIAESTALLHIIATLTTDDVLRQRIRRELPNRRQPMPRIVDELDQTRVGSAIQMGGSFQAATNIILGVHFPGSGECAFTVLVAHYLDDAVKDAFCVPGGVDAFLTAVRDYPDSEHMSFDTISLADARACLEPGLDYDLDPEDATENETWSQMRPLLRWLLSLMPEGGTGFGSPSPERAAAIARASMEAMNEGAESGAYPESLLDGDAYGLPESPLETKLLRVRIELDGARPPIWRRVDVCGDLTLDGLHIVVQEAMGWADSHLHRFSLDSGPGLYGGRGFVTDHDLDEGERGVYEGVVSVDQVLREPGDELYYVYDFGDDWRHTIRLEEVRPCPDEAPSAVVVDGERAAPPENCGGLPGYEMLLEALATGRRDGPVMVPPDYDPDEFDPAAANLALTVLELDPGELERIAGDGAPDIHPALDSLLAALPMQDGIKLAALTALGDPDDVVSDAEISAALRDWRLILNLAADGGIELTAAGWMKPVVVERIFTELGLGQDWVGKGNREDQTLPVLRIREKAVGAGLLRKFKGRLVLTPAARELADDRALWEYLAERVLGDLEPDSGQAHAVALMLLHLQAEELEGDETLDEIGVTLARAGWKSRDGEPLDAALVAQFRAWSLTEIQGATAGGRDAPADPRIRRAFAREALRLP